jgi:hypothetical protein
MKLVDCEYTGSKVTMAPLRRNQPEEMWVRERAKGSIPEPLFNLYKRASYLSFGRAPSFLQDQDNILFSYFCMMVRSLASLLVDIDQENEAFVEAEKNQYYPGKQVHDPTWTKEKSESAIIQMDRTFKNLFISLYGSLDTVSEIIAIFSQGGIKGLEVGQAQFYAIEVWLKNNYKPPNRIMTPRDIYLEKLHSKLKPIIHRQPPETGWLTYMRLMRNKVAHLGNGPLRFGRLRGNDGAAYTFAPRVWPYLWERDVKPSDQQSRVDMRELLLKTLVHQDVVEYMRGATRKIKEVVHEACSLTANAYTDFENFGFNQIALDELDHNSKECSFQHFL